MDKTISNIMPVGAPWGGPESFKFLSCFTSLFMLLEKTDCEGRLYCDRDVRLCNRCGECGVTEWSTKHHEQIYHGFLTLSGVSCANVWPPEGDKDYFADHPLAYSDERYLERTMDFAGYTYRLLRNASEEEMRRAIQESIDSGIPVLAFGLVNDDWCLVSGCSEDGGTLFGGYAAESQDDPQKRPERVVDGVFARSHWFNDGLALCLITGRKAPRVDYDEVFLDLKATLRRSDNARGISGLAAYEACKAALLDEERIARASREELARLYTRAHTFIGVLAEGRCFAAFAFWSGFFGRITDEATLARMKRVGDRFMDTHNQCWGAWAVMGKDHRCQPELYLERFALRETRVKLAGYIDVFRANDEGAIKEWGMSEE